MWFREKTRKSRPWWAFWTLWWFLQPVSCVFGQRLMKLHKNVFTCTPTVGLYTDWWTLVKAWQDWFYFISGVNCFGGTKEIDTWQIDRLWNLSKFDFSYHQNPTLLFECFVVFDVPLQTVKKSRHFLPWMRFRVFPFLLNMHSPILFFVLTRRTKEVYKFHLLQNEEPRIYYCFVIASLFSMPPHIFIENTLVSPPTFCFPF